MPHYQIFVYLSVLSAAERILAYRVNHNKHGSGGREAFQRQQQRQLVIEEDTPNTDRLQCQRQDNLDLLYPSDPKHIVRLVVPVNAGDTGRDIYIVADEIHFIDVSAKIRFRRVPNKKLLEFEIYGDTECIDTKYKDCAAADFRVSLDVQTRSSVIDWVASLAADRDELRKGQLGKLRFKLAGQAEAKYDDDSGNWELQLSNTNTRPFDFEITNQYIVQTALNKYGGIDKLVMEQLFPIIQQNIPVSLVAAFNYIEYDDLNLDVELVVKGGQKDEETSSKLLNLDIDLAKASLRVDFTKMIGEFLDEHQIDFRQLAKEKVEKWLEDPDLQELWETNKPQIIRNLQLYGWLTPTILARVQEVDNIQELRSDLVKAVEGTADVLYQSLTVFMDRYKQGKRMSLDGFDLELQLAELGWDADVDNGLIKARVTAPKPGDAQDLMKSYRTEDITGQELLVSILSESEESEGYRKLFSCRKGFLDFFGINDIVTSPKSGFTEVKAKDLSLKDGRLELKQLVLEQVLMRIVGTNGTTDSIYKIEGEASKLFVDLPKSMAPPIKVDVVGTLTHIGVDGQITQYIDQDGLFVQQAPRDPSASTPAPHIPKRLLRFGGKAPSKVNSARIDGKLPKNLSRPTLLSNSPSLIDFAPSSTADLKFLARGRGSHLVLNSDSHVVVSVDLPGILRGALAQRPAFDFGYVFFAHRLERRVEHPESRELNGPTVAVVSCGQLLLIPRLLNEDVNLLAFEPKSGFLQVDLAQYRTPPEVTVDPTNARQTCLLLYSGGQRPRKTGFFSNEVKEELCGPRDKVQELLNAVNLQIQRFQDTRAKKWNFGTHNATKEQYLLPGGATTVDLVTIVTNSMKQSVPTGLLESSSSFVPASSDVNEEAIPHSDSLETHQSKSREDPTKPNSTTATYGDYGAASLAESALEEEAEVPLPKYTSTQRAYCFAVEELDRKYFPPEQYSNRMLRIAVGPFPMVGVCYISIDEIHITQIAMAAEIGRRGDEQFTFKMKGINGSQHAAARAFVKGLEFECPDGHLDDLAKFFANTANLAGKIFTLGFMKDYSRVDQFPIDIDLSMSADALIGRYRRWEIDKTTAKSYAKIRMEGGGPALDLVNLLVGVFGGMDQIFLDIIFPLITQLIPPKAAESFRKVKYDDGRVEHRFTLEAWCADPIGRTCPSQELRVKAYDMTSFFLHLEPIARAMVQPDGYLGQNGSLKTSIERALEFYAQNKSVLGDFQSKLELQMDLDANRKLKTGSILSAHMPFHMIESFLGSGFEDFVPNDDGSLSASGKLDFSKGELRIRNMNINNVALPLATSAGDETESVKLGAQLDRLSIERTEGPPDASGLSLWEEDSAIVAKIRRLGAHVSREHGAQIRLAKDSLGRKNLELELSPEYVTKLLTESTAQLSVPQSLRTGSAENADGKIPEKFQGPFSESPVPLDLSRTIQDLRVNVSLDPVACYRGACATKMKKLGIKGIDTTTRELLDISATINLAGTLKLDSKFYDSVLRMHVPDDGYLNFMMPGRYGQLDKKGTLPERTAIAKLLCGSLVIYLVPQKDASKYKGYKDRNMIDSAKYIELDLTQKYYVQMVDGDPIKGLGGESRYKCIRVKEAQDLLFGLWANGYRHFCGLPEDGIDDLWEAITLQIIRFKDNQDAFRRVSQLKKWYDTDMPVQTASEKAAGVDGTWFFANDPYDPQTFQPQRMPPADDAQVATPNQRWQRTLEKLRFCKKTGREGCLR